MHSYRVLYCIGGEESYGFTTKKVVVFDEGSGDMDAVGLYKGMGNTSFGLRVSDTRYLRVLKGRGGRVEERLPCC